MSLTSPYHDLLRPQAANLPESGIVKVLNYGFNREGLIPLWAGEGDLPTPDFISDAAHRSMRAGETFYTYQRGLPQLRQALADYHARLYKKPFSSERFFITGSGMQAIQIAVQALAGEGDEVVVPTPAWPNIAAALEIIGAKPVLIPQDFSDNGWQMDLQRLFDACSDKTKAIFINSPQNPTGWTATQDELQTILNFAREKNIWILSDEVYARFYYPSTLAPSFYNITEPDDKIIMLNTFSKNWAMTGWRIGWLNVPIELGQVMENLIQFNTSGVAAFMQRGAIAALNDGEDFIHEQVERARQGRDIVARALQNQPKVRFSPPEGAFYQLFAIEGYEDSMALAHKLVDEANIGLAPGTAFGPGGEAFLRLCFARSGESLTEAMDRLTSWLDKH